MATYYRRDDDVQNGLGEAVPNIAVTYYAAGGGLATIYADAAGSVMAANPQYTDGLGQTHAYMASGFYTITYSGPQIQTLTYTDQAIGIGSGGSGTTIVPFAGIPSGTINGANKVFTLTNGGTPLTSAPTQSEVWLNFPLVEGVGYTLTGVTIVYTNAPVSGDTLWAQGVTIS
jgi:hypothetical protein